MTPKKTTELVEIEYWTCHVPTHRHRTLAVAQSCSAKSEKPKTEKRRWTKEQLADVLESVVDGQTMKSVGTKYGISGGRIRQVFDKARRIAIHPSRVAEGIPEHRWWEIPEMRHHADFWKRQAARIRTE